MKKYSFKNIQIKANYSFWKHPIKWVKERELRNTMQALFDYEWEHSVREQVEKEVKYYLLHGRRSSDKKCKCV